MQAGIKTSRGVVKGLGYRWAAPCRIGRRVYSIPVETLLGPTERADRICNERAKY